ncbi:MAG: hypothetical protein DDT32_01623 [Syntrophomonadaceae bacterium]|nr:hypothetical protein [Bacillota bacterium]MBT9147857.1 hypothetical protein [Bacillota bacterium]
MDQVTIFNSSKPDIGLFTRPATCGDEYALVEMFIEYYCHTFIRNNKKTHLAVFVEPRIDSGFPDVVFVSYLPSITNNWSDRREALDVFDLKLLSYLCATENALGTKLISTLGFPEKQTITSLEKLMDAKLVTYRNHSWRVRELRDAFGITKLVAVEAKLNDISKVVEQTYLNTRFASHSYALTNSARPQGETVKTFKRFGIGLYGKDSQFHRIVEAKQYTLPSSYLSFQFNEWIGKSIARQGGTLYA